MKRMYCEKGGWTIAYNINDEVYLKKLGWEVVEDEPKPEVKKDEPKPEPVVEPVKNPVGRPRKTS